MTLARLLTILLTLHTAFAIAQVHVFYFGGGQVDGGRDFIANTPFREFTNVETYSDEEPPSISALGNIFGTLTSIVGTIDSLISFNYDVLNDLAPDDGVLYNIVWIVKLIGVVLWFRMGLGVMNLIFRSNILTSPIGLVAVGAGGLLYTAAKEGVSI